LQEKKLAFKVAYGSNKNAVSGQSQGIAPGEVQNCLELLGFSEIYVKNTACQGRHVTPEM
jgi:hypothetical protein